MSLIRKYYSPLFLLLFLIIACDAEEDIVIIEGNEVDASREQLSNEQIEFYINRMYIDLIGREPLDEEMQMDFDLLKDQDLSSTSRLSIIDKLQRDTQFVEGDTSYLHAYAQNLYQLAKIKMIEGASDREFAEIIGILKSGMFVDSVAGNWERVSLRRRNIQRHQNVLNANIDFRRGEISYLEMLARMTDNNIFDAINMNTFNFVLATFDLILHRFPTNAEFSAAFDICENDESGSLFGQTASNKREFIQLIINSDEARLGLIIDQYRLLLARDPSVEEISSLLISNQSIANIREIQKKIISTNEYANF